MHQSGHAFGYLGGTLVNLTKGRDTWLVNNFFALFQKKKLIYNF